ncbi:hypothetical protein [Paenibacillus sp. FSL L8-0463]
MPEDKNEPRGISLKGSVDKQSARISEYEILKNKLTIKEETNRKEEKNNE